MFVSRRKKSGTASLNKTLKTILADTPLVRNLENPEYLKTVLNGCASLAERFAQIDDELARDKLKQASTDQGKVPSGLKKLIKQLDLPQKISDFFVVTAILMPTVICGHRIKRLENN